MYFYNKKQDLKSSVEEVLTINRQQESTLATQASTIESLQGIIQVFIMLLQSLKQKAEDRNEKCKILQHYSLEKRKEIAGHSVVLNHYKKRVVYLYLIKEII